MIPTLLSTSTASNASSVSITSSITSTYDHYMFVMTDIGPADNNVDFSFQVNGAGESGFNETMNTAVFRGSHEEDDSPAASIAYSAGADQANGTAYQLITNATGNGSDESCAGILHLFSPASTTYAKLFYCRMSNYGGNNVCEDQHVAGYINTTTAIDEISFKMSSGNFDGVIQMFGIA
jgi:hypothetical protein